MTAGQAWTNQENGDAFEVGSTIRTVGTLPLWQLINGAVIPADFPDELAFSPGHFVVALEGNVTGPTSAEYTAGSLYLIPSTNGNSTFYDIDDPASWNFENAIAKWDLGPAADIADGVSLGVSHAGPVTATAAEVNVSELGLPGSSGNGLFVFLEDTSFVPSGVDPGIAPFNGSEFVRDVEAVPGLVNTAEGLAAFTDQTLDTTLIPLTADQISILDQITLASAGVTGAFSAGGYTPVALGTGTGDFSADFSSEAYVIGLSGDVELASLGDFVWHDLDADGIQDAGEPGIPGVQVNLKDAGGVVIDTTVTAADGSYAFTGLQPGTYSVQFIQPAGFTEVSPLNAGGDDTVDSDADPNMALMTATTTLGPGDNDPTLDAGFYNLASLGDFVWHDLDADGIQDAGEPGIPGVQVNLKDSGGVVIDTTVTAADGSYAFTGLQPGTYSVQFVQPAGFTEVSPLDAGGDDTVDSDADPNMALMTATTTLASGEDDPTLDAGFYNLASLGDFVWHDLDADGIQDAGEPGIPGVQVNLKDSGGVVIDTTVTAADGSYAFTGLQPGTYSVQFIQPAGFTEVSPLNAGGDDTVDSDADPNMALMTATTTLASGEDDPTLDAGFYNLASLGDFVWHDLDADGIQDAGEPGIPGVQVNLKDSGGVVIDTTVTAADGSYAFTGLQPGTYSVQFVQPAGFTEVSPLDAGGDDTVDSDADPNMALMTATTTLASGEDDPTLDAGFYNLASLGDFVWHDLDADGIQDAGEPGIPGVQVNLKDSGGVVIDTTVTAADGSYAFTGLQPGTYSVQFIQPAGFTEVSPLDAGGDDTVDSDADPNMALMTATTTLASGEDDPTLDAGFYNLASLGDFVWHDLDADGIQDAGEPGIPGVQVNLKDSGGVVIDTTVTAADGSYAFTGLQPGTYSVQFIQPAGFTEVSPLDAGGDDTVDSDADPNMALMTATTTLASGEDDPTLDAGFYNLASLGDFVWHDLDAVGIQDAGEPGVSGVTVTLTGTDGQGNAVSDTLITGPNGEYLFDNLVPGDYKVTFSDLPANFVFTGQDQGIDDTLDSDADPNTGMTIVTTLVSGENDLTWDAGIYLPPPPVNPDIDIEKFVKVVDDQTGGGEGLTPGFWKTHSEFGPAPLKGWPDTGFSPLDSYNSVFGVSDDSGLTLLSALGRGGGGLNALGRHATAALLNAANPNVDYAYTEAEVISLTQAAYASGDASVIEGTKNLFAIQNELGADLNTPADEPDTGLDGFGVDADTPPGPSAQLGDTIVFTYFVTNPGDVELSPVVVSDDNATPGDPGDDFNPDPVEEDDGNGNFFNVGDDDQDGRLDPGESWLYQAQITALEVGQFTNLGTVIGTPVDENGDPIAPDVTDEDPANYNVAGTPDIDIEKLTNGVDADQPADAPEIVVGGEVTWTYLVTNTGNVPFSQSEVEVVDDNGTPSDTSDDFSTATGDIVLDSNSDENSDGILSPGEQWVFTAVGVAQDLGGGGGEYRTFVTTGNSGLDGSNGNIRSFSAGDISVHASAFSSSGNTFQTAFLGAFSSGLGVTDRSEGDGGNGLHRVDNIDQINYVLFEFSESVVVDQALLDSVVSDSDISYWIGTIENAYNDHVSLDQSVLDGLAQRVNNTSHSSTRWADLNSDELTGNVLVIAASVEDSTPEDRFKIKKVKVRESVGGVYKNIGVVTTGPDGPTDSDPSHYINIDANPGIDIEKSTNGVDADHQSEAPEILVGAPVNWTYVVTNTGNVPYSSTEVQIVDDNGTPGDSGDDFSTGSGDITLDSNSDVGSDGILSPGEQWVFNASGIAQQLSGGAGETRTFVTTGTSGLDGENGNVRTYSDGGVNVKASAFSSDSGVFETAFLGAFSSGLGVTDRGEGNGSNGLHRVDNVGRINYVVFEFSESVIVDQVLLDSVVNDSDMSYWIGTIEDAYHDHVSLDASVLNSLTQRVNNTRHSSARWADINPETMAGNVLVIAASVEDSTPEDRFKIRKVKVRETVGGVYKNIGVVTTGPDGPTDSDPSHYKNAVVAPGIDIEKYTNGFDADDASQAPGIEVGDTVTWTYVVTNTGNVAYSVGDVQIVDDNGTPGHTGDDFSTASGDIVLNPNSDVGSDGMLSPGELWVYNATGIAQDLSGGAGDTHTFVTTGSSGLDGSDGNIRTFSSGGVSVKASAFSSDNGVFETAFLGAYSGGLGVTDRGEGNGNYDRHKVDNVGRINYVLFEFSEPVIVDKTLLASVTNDSDMSYWIGTIDDAFNQHVSLDASVLDGLVQRVNNTGHGSSRWADINPDDLAGNVLVIAASVEDATPEDRFKIKKVNVRETAAGVYKNIGVVSTGHGGPTDSDASHYKNAPAGTGSMTTMVNSYDVNLDGGVSALDALNVINSLSSISAEGEMVEGSGDPAADVNGDGILSPSDALAIINHLSNDGGSEIDSEASSMDMLINSLADDDDEEEDRVAAVDYLLGNALV
ncbi:SdrD B-like domain-containing protein [Stieleria maiorica]|nr:SdrD B-like domain-containing protein [Stieleria maiorica]